jgi:hypothetical protein
VGQTNGHNGNGHTNGNGKGPNGRRSRSVNGNGSANGSQNGHDGSSALAVADPPITAELNFRQRLFVEAFLGEAKGVAMEAARIAGYAFPNVDGTRLLANVRIKAAVEQRLTEASLSSNEILARLSEQATGLTPEYWTKDGKLDFPALRRDGKTHLIRRVTPTKQGRAYELADPQQALVTLAKYRGLLVERVQVNVNVGEYDDPVQLAAIERGEDPGPPRKRSSPQVQQAQLESSPKVIETTATVEVTKDETSKDSKKQNPKEKNPERKNPS